MWSFGKGPGLAFPPKTDGDFGSNKTMFWLNLYDHRIAQLVEFSVQHQSFCSLWLLKTPKAPKSLEFLDSPTQYRRHA
jgi:hypothetical protein